MPQQFQFFMGKAVDVIRVLLVNYPKTWTIRALAKESHVSLGWTSKVSNALIREKLAIKESTRGELKLMAPHNLLTRWAYFNDFGANSDLVEYYSPEQDITKFFSRLGSSLGPIYAVTLVAGALLVAPHVRATDVYLYVNSESDAHELGKVLQLLPVEKRGNIHFAIPQDKGVFYGSQEIDGVTIVSDIQLYVDLMNYQGRGVEAANEVFYVIEKCWKEREAVNVRQRNH